jgi:7,8-dihydropterin-6-yl-methyl-4-(beta-D-ribofuranosyl)aminobenzene 5'-phosphate synthase
LGGFRTPNGIRKSSPFEPLQGGRRVSSFERGFPGHLRRCEDGADWEPDELLMDERFLAADIAGKVLATFPRRPIFAGVVRTLPVRRQRDDHTSDGRGPARFELKKITAGHGAGWRAPTALGHAFGDDIVAPMAVRKTLRL